MSELTEGDRAFVEWAINCPPNKGARQLGMSAKQFRALRKALGAIVIGKQLRAAGKPWHHLAVKAAEGIRDLPPNIRKAVHDDV